MLRKLVGENSYGNGVNTVGSALLRRVASVDLRRAGDAVTKTEGRHSNWPSTGLTRS
jgi:hypothetical protein